MVIEMKHVILNHSYKGYSKHSAFFLRLNKHYLDLIRIIGAIEKQIINWACNCQAAFRVEPRIG